MLDYHSPPSRLSVYVRLVFGLSLKFSHCHHFQLQVSTFIWPSVPLFSYISACMFFLFIMQLKCILNAKCISHMHTTYTKSFMQYRLYFAAAIGQLMQGRILIPFSLSLPLLPCPDKYHPWKLGQQGRSPA